MNLSKYNWHNRRKDITSTTMHNVFGMGTIEDIRTILLTIPKDTILEDFVKHPQKSYTKESYNFIKNLILKLNVKLDEHKYIKTTPRNTR